MIVRYGALQETVKNACTVAGLKAKFGRLWGVPSDAVAFWRNPHKINTQDWRKGHDGTTFTDPDTEIEFFKPALSYSHGKDYSNELVLIEVQSSDEAELEPGAYETC